MSSLNKSIMERSRTLLLFTVHINTINYTVVPQNRAGDQSKKCVVNRPKRHENAR